MCYSCAPAADHFEYFILQSDCYFLNLIYGIKQVLYVPQVQGVIHQVFYIYIYIFNKIPKVESVQ